MQFSGWLIDRARDVAGSAGLQPRHRAEAFVARVLLDWFRLKREDPRAFRGFEAFVQEELAEELRSPR